MPKSPVRKVSIPIQIWLNTSQHFFFILPPSDSHCHDLSSTLASRDHTYTMRAAPNVSHQSHRPRINLNAAMKMQPTTFLFFSATPKLVVFLPAYPLSPRFSFSFSFSLSGRPFPPQPPTAAIPHLPCRICTFQQPSGSKKKKEEKFMHL